ALDAVGGIAQGADRGVVQSLERRLVLAGLHGELVRRQRHAVVALGQFDQCGIAAFAHGRDDRSDSALHLGVDSIRRPIEGAEHRRLAERSHLEPAHHRALDGAWETSWRMAAINALIRACRVLSEARLTIRRAVDVTISATSTRPLARNVSPDCTRSTM